VLRGYPADLGGGFLSDRFSGGDDTFDVLQLRAAAALRPSAAVPATLADVPRLDPADAVRTRDFRLSGHTINGHTMDPERVDEVVTRGSTEIWSVRNAGGEPHTFHVHGASFHVLAVGGGDPPAHLRGAKDTVLVSRDHPVRLAVQFRSYTDPDMPYMFHCHILQHEDNGMMGQFVVVEPGTEGTVATTLTGSDHRNAGHW